MTVDAPPTSASVNAAIRPISPTPPDEIGAPI
jgi:hypothetical protein